jgi:hypothetical protein
MPHIEKDQTHCPKCGWMYCEGYWGEGVCIADMHFCGEPTADGDAVADYVRQWYERNRESWWDRCRLSRNQQLLNAGCADSFILSLISEVARVQSECERQNAARRLREAS